MKERASVFENTEDFDISEFTTQTPTPSSKPALEAIQAVSQAARFPSREPSAVVSKKSSARKREIRRYRTGRNVQFNVKLDTATRDGLYEISDRQKWVLGETLQHALAALKEKLAGQAQPT